MTLQTSGPISLANTNQELSRPVGSTISLGESEVRGLFEVPTGPISLSHGYGKTGTVYVNLVISANTLNYNIKTAVGGIYFPGKTRVTVTINPGVVVGSASSAAYALDTGTGWTNGDAIYIINNGYIMGTGGSGGHGGGGQPTWYNKPAGAGYGGGPGLIIRYPTTITNGSGYIYSGGGGGGGGASSDGIYWLFSLMVGGGGGGGGAGYNAGASGPGQGGNGGEPGLPGGAGSALVGGTGGVGGGAWSGIRTGYPGGVGGTSGPGGTPVSAAEDVSVGGGGGGGPGYAGGNGAGNAVRGGAAGGGGSIAITGAAHITWISGSTRYAGSVIS